MNDFSVGWGEKLWAQFWFWWQRILVPLCFKTWLSSDSNAVLQWYCGDPSCQVSCFVKFHCTLFRIGFGGCVCIAQNNFICKPVISYSIFVLSSHMPRVACDPGFPSKFLSFERSKSFYACGHRSPLHCGTVCVLLWTSTIFESPYYLYMTITLRLGCTYLG